MNPHRIYVVVVACSHSRGSPNGEYIGLIAWCHTPDEAEAMRLKLEEQRGRYIEAWGPAHAAPSSFRDNYTEGENERKVFLAQMLDRRFTDNHREFRVVKYETQPVLDDPLACCECGNSSTSRALFSVEISRRLTYVYDLPVNPSCPFHGGDPHEQVRRARVRSNQLDTASIKDRDPPYLRPVDRPLAVGDAVRLVGPARRTVKRRASGVLYGVVTDVHTGRPLVDVRVIEGMSSVLGLTSTHTDGHRLPRSCSACRGEGRIDASVEGDRARDCYMCDGYGRLPAAVATVVTEGAGGTTIHDEPLSRLRAVASGQPIRCADCGHTRDEHGEVLDGGTACTIGENRSAAEIDRCLCRAWRAPRYQPTCQTCGDSPPPGESCRTCGDTERVLGGDS